MQTDELVERVARAIFRATFSPDEDEALVAEKWQEWPECRQRSERQARAALASIPTDAGADELRLEWRDGPPPKPWSEEWFIAMTTYGDRVVLRALPEEYTYDFKTADDTYIRADKIKKWMQFPDSSYIAPTHPPAEFEAIAQARKDALEKAATIAEHHRNARRAAHTDAHRRGAKVQATSLLARSLEAQQLAVAIRSLISKDQPHD